LTAVFCLKLLNLLFGKNFPPPATAVPPSAATKAMIATIMAALGRRRMSFFIWVSKSVADSP
jgi:hypothetical protein